MCVEMLNMIKQNIEHYLFFPSLTIWVQMGFKNRSPIYVSQDTYDVSKGERTALSVHKYLRQAMLVHRFFIIY